ncbi:MAG TPA: 4-oxalocrotonate tautomerase family protein, partial [Candidatus Sulfotelmatobacter sp.]|nr:4-oxalocrotonate tautomerase family protein [Candidatus Sulfotelmatobacter sp.]
SLEYRLAGESALNRLSPWDHASSLSHARPIVLLCHAVRAHGLDRETFPEVVAMPLVNVKLIEGVFSTQQKQEIVRRLTDTMVDIEGENMRQVTWVVVEEVKSGDWGIGGRPLETSDVKALQQGLPVG